MIRVTEPARPDVFPETITEFLGVMMLQHLKFVLGLVLVQGSISCFAEVKTIGRIERLDDRIHSFIDDDAIVEILAGGFEWTEGPVWIENPEMLDGSKDAEPFLLFSDIPRNSIMKFTPSQASNENHGISLFMKPSGYTGVANYGQEPGSNGLSLDLEGRLIACEHGDRRLSLLTPKGGKLTLADRFDGKRLNSPNDLVIDSKGNIFFTDPPYGLPHQEREALQQLDFCGVYRLDVDGKLTLLTKELVRPNGIELSPDEATLYVAQSDSERPVWMAYPIRQDGTIGQGKVLADAKKFMSEFPGAPDGLVVHSSGTLFASGPGGVYVMTPEGELLGRFLTEGRVSNCTLTADESVLYMTADDDLCCVRLKK